MRMKKEEKYIKRRTIASMIAAQGLIAVYVGIFMIWLVR